MRLNIVNLERRADRRAQFIAWNERPGLQLKFRTAVDGATLSRAALQAEGVLAADEAMVTNGGIGNALSHRALWREAVSTGDPIFICEDDCCLRADFTDEAPRLLSLLPANWDVVFFAFNTDANVALQSPAGLNTVMTFDERGKSAPAAFDRFAHERTGLLPATIARCFQRWGTLCYGVSPSGAEKLIRWCFPITTTTPVVMFGQNRVMKPTSMDGMICLALQRQDIDAYCAFPPLAISENVRATSDVARPPAGS